MMLRIVIPMVAMTLAGCATESRVVLPNGDTYTVRSQHDAKVDFQQADIKISVDNRGRAGLIEQVVTAPIAGIAGATGAIMQNSLKEAVVK